MDSQGEHPGRRGQHEDDLRREKEEKETEGALWGMNQGADMPEEIKEELVEEYDGTYVCFICSKSVRGRDALQCSQCQSNPFHRACVAKYPGWAESCATCGRQTIEDWSLKSTSSHAPIDMIDLTSGSEGPGRRKDEEDAKECDVRNLAARVHALEEERRRAAEAAKREEETHKLYEDRLKEQAARIHALEEERRRAAEAAKREEETRKSYEDRLKEQGRRGPTVVSVRQGVVLRRKVSSTPLASAAKRDDDPVTPLSYVAVLEANNHGEGESQSTTVTSAVLPSSAPPTPPQVDSSFTANPKP
jgi:hypothetical protein